jgi:hypothetical protein
VQIFRLQQRGLYIPLINETNDSGRELFCLPNFQTRFSAQIPIPGRASNKRRSEWQLALSDFVSVHVVLNFHHSTFGKGNNYLVEPARCLELYKTNAAIGCKEFNKQVKEIMVREPRKMIQEPLVGMKVLLNIIVQSQ